MSDARIADQPHSDSASTSDALRRAFDVVVSCVALTILAPVLLIIAIAILLESGHPVFFRQIRLGKNGKPFAMYKFRKFHRDCGTSGSPLTLKEDSRMTKVGRILASTKLDELPQLWNALKGDMSIVGPRPESLPFADCFIGTFRLVLDHKPGILGPSQVAFRNECLLYPSDGDPTEFYREVIFPAKARIDLDYYSRRSLIHDVAWILRGVAAVLGFTQAVSYTASEALADYLPKTTPQTTIVAAASNIYPQCGTIEHEL